MSQHVDIAIVGAGMVGSTLAVAFAQDPSLNIALIEPVPHKPIEANDPNDLRVSAISQASENIFKNLAIWPHFITERLSPFREMTVWETQQSKIHFDSAEVGMSHLGHLIENRHIQQACLQQCQRHNNIQLLCPDKPVSRDGNQLTLDSDKQLTANLIVAADGAQSPLRDWANIDFQGWDYQQQGLVCNVTTEKPHNLTARQRFLPTGPLAFLPLADPHQCTIVWSNTDDNIDELKQLDEDAFKLQLAEVFEHTLGDITDIGSRASFPLKRRHASQYVQQGFALVGDAAHTIHPLAGQGVNIGLLDAATLAEVVLEAHQKGGSIGSVVTLEKYQRRRKGDNLAIQFTMDAFNFTFKSDNPLITNLRQFGFRSVQQSQLLKNCFIQQASGQRFANPSLTQISHLYIS